MNFLQTLIYGYPRWADGSFVDVTGQDFVDHLSVGAPGWIVAWIGLGLTVVFGLLVYIFPIIMTENEHIQCYPLWLHCFYWAADFMGIWVFYHAWDVYHHFPLFLLLSIGEAIWVLMETYCLVRAVQYERSIIWKAGTKLSTMVGEIVCLTLFFYLCLNFLRFEWHDETMWKFWIFTQVLVTTVPVWELRKRGYRSGNCLALSVTFICVALVSFNPWLNMWLSVKPEFFSLSANPWYYLTGLFCLASSVYGLYLYLKLPPKEDIMHSGKKAILK
ncbi:MAG: ABC transporter permease [Clostridia bacterium]|nr:ABC transporter permease [Clostridia bacterium]